MGSLRTTTAPQPAENDPSMAPKAKTKAPELTLHEVTYLRHLIDEGVPVRVKLSNNEEVCGLIEFFDQSFIRITRKGEPNLFLYKHDIKYLYEDD
jgi:host factor-I protein